MKELQRKQYIRKLLYSYLSLFVLAVITIFFARGAFNIIMIERQSAGRVKELEQQAASLMLREEELKNDIAKLQTEEGVVEEIKNKFSVTREGEYVAVIVDERKKASSTEEERPAWYKRFWNAIIGK